MTYTVEIYLNNQLKGIAALSSDGKQLGHVNVAAQSDGFIAGAYDLGELILKQAVEAQQ